MLMRIASFAFWTFIGLTAAIVALVIFAFWPGKKRGGK